MSGRRRPCTPRWTSDTRTDGSRSLLSGNAAGVDKLAEAWAADGATSPSTASIPIGTNTGKRRGCGQPRHDQGVRRRDRSLGRASQPAQSTPSTMQAASCSRPCASLSRAVSTMFMYFNGSNGGARAAAARGRRRPSERTVEGARARPRSRPTCTRLSPAPVLPERSAHPTHVLWRDGGKPKPFVILLMVADDKDAARFLEDCRRRRDNEKVHGHCFQREGTRHFTIVKGIRDKQAERLASANSARCRRFPRA